MSSNAHQQRIATLAQHVEANRAWLERVRGQGPAFEGPAKRAYENSKRALEEYKAATRATVAPMPRQWTAAVDRDVSGVASRNRNI